MAKRSVKSNVNESKEFVSQLMALTGSKDMSELKANLSQVFSMYEAQHVALEGMGVISLIVVPKGMYMFTVSPNLYLASAGLDAVEKAVTDFSEKFVKPARKRLIEAEVKKSLEKSKEETQ